MQKFAVILTAIFSIFFMAEGFAQTTRPKVAKRQVNQQKKIRQGKRTGQLTPGETRQLQRQQEHINRTKRSAKADGTVTRAERAKIHQKQNRANRNIYHKKNNETSRNQ